MAANNNGKSPSRTYRAIDETSASFTFRLSPVKEAGLKFIIVVFIRLKMNTRERVIRIEELEEKLEEVAGGMFGGSIGSIGVWSGSFR
ncbi:hypothetical protein PUR_40370 [Paenibacillus sp. URB8-2]|nr:hypothetical protein PUR_40370 [Paenibacillus sp. URB8-2]